jgi:hypothetical protein
MNHKKRTLNENLLVFGLAFVTLFTWVVIKHWGLSQKWFAATAGTIIPFGLVLSGYRQALNRWPFWAAFGICLLCHLILIWFIFDVLLSGIERFSVLFWFPFLLAEFFVLLVAVAKIKNRLFREKEPITLRF